VKTPVAILALAMALAAATPAFASDLPTNKTPPAPTAPLPAPFSWTGFYLGVQGGYVWGDSHRYWPAFGTHNSHTSDGGVFGGQAGYNYQFSTNWVAGVEASAAWADVNGQSTCPNPNANCRTTADFVGDVSGRLGYAIDRTLLFAKGGVALVDQDHFGIFPATPAFNEEGGKGVRAGFLLGAGVEYAFTNNITAKVEYDYIGLGTDAFNANRVATGAFVEAVRETSYYQTLKVGLNYKF
jgi:outer membrane immunogenic protein